MAGLTFRIRCIYKPALPGHAPYTDRCGALFMDDIKKLYNEHLRASFPPGIGGEEIQGIDLALTDMYTAGLIDKYISRRGQLTPDDFKILNHCYSDLKVIVKELKGTNRKYFARLHDIARLVIKKIES